MLHISTHEYYRSLIALGEDLQANITQLLKEQEKAREVIAEAEQAKKDLARIKAEAKTEELKNSATKTATTTKKSSAPLKSHVPSCGK